MDVLPAAECDLNGVLRWYVRAQLYVGEDGDVFEVARGVLLRFGDHHPAGTEAGEPVCFRQFVEGECEQVGSDLGEWHVHCVVIEDLVVDLVGYDYQVVLPGEVGDVA